MRAIEEMVNSISLAIGGWCGYVLGGYDTFLYALVLFVVVDYVTGVMCAIVEKELASELGYKGIFKKVMLFGLVGIAHTVDKSLIGDGSVIRTAVIFFYIANEGISILENAARLGVPIPEKLKEVLMQLKQKGDSNVSNKK